MNIGSYWDFYRGKTEWKILYQITQSLFLFLRAWRTVAFGPPMKPPYSVRTRLLLMGPTDRHWMGVRSFTYCHIVPSYHYSHVLYNWTGTSVPRHYFQILLTHNFSIKWIVNFTVNFTVNFPDFNIPWKKDENDSLSLLNLRKLNFLNSFLFSAAEMLNNTCLWNKTVLAEKRNCSIVGIR